MRFTRRQRRAWPGRSAPPRPFRSRKPPSPSGRRCGGAGAAAGGSGSPPRSSRRGTPGGRPRRCAFRNASTRPLPASVTTSASANSAASASITASSSRSIPSPVRPLTATARGWCASSTCSGERSATRVDLVQHQDRRLLVALQFLQHRVHGADVVLGLRAARVDDVQQQLRVPGLGRASP